MDTMNTKIAGIPCVIRVEYANVVQPNRWADNDQDYRGYTDFEYEVCDRRGRPAPWLAKKLTSDDEARIMDEYFS